MKKIISLSLLISIILMGSLSACTKKEISTEASLSSGTDVSQSAQDTSKSKQIDSILWKVEKNGQPISYLLGTIHIGKIGAKLPKEMLSALSATDTLMTEANMTPDMQEQLQLSQLILDPEGNLEQKLGEADFLILTETVQSVPAQALRLFKPWAAFTFTLYSKPNGFSEEFGIDKLLTKEAILTNKNRLFLETIEEQMQFFANVPEEKIIVALKATLQNTESNKKDTQQLIDYYEENNLNQLNSMVFNTENNLKNFPKSDHAYWEHWFYQILLNDRNHHWLTVIEQQLAKDSTLIAVGSAHLLGKEGLVQLLRDKGYTLTPILFNH